MPGEVHCSWVQLSPPNYLGWPGAVEPCANGQIGPIDIFRSNKRTMRNVMQIIVHLLLKPFQVCQCHICIPLSGFQLSGFYLWVPSLLVSSLDSIFLETICLVPVPCISSVCHMYLTDFAYDGAIFLVSLSPSYTSLPV